MQNDKRNWGPFLDYLVVVTVIMIFERALASSLALAGG